MSFLLMVFTFVIICLFLGVIFLSKNKLLLKKPSLRVILAIILQIVIMVLFFEDVLLKVPRVVTYILWWATVIYGVICGIMEFKNNVIVSFLSIMLSFFLAGFMLLLLFITSM